MLNTAEYPLIYITPPFAVLFAIVEFMIVRLFLAQIIPSDLSILFDMVVFNNSSGEFASIAAP